MIYIKNTKQNSSNDFFKNKIDSYVDLSIFLSQGYLDRGLWLGRLENLFPVELKRKNETVKIAVNSYKRTKRNQRYLLIRESTVLETSLPCIVSSKLFCVSKFSTTAQAISIFLLVSH